MVDFSWCWEIVYPCIPDPDGEDEGGQAPLYPSSFTYPAEELCISSFDYSTTTAGSGWEPKGRVAAKAEDSTKWRRCSVYSGFDEEVEGISGADRSPYKASAGAISHRFNAADGESFAQDI
ncbi:hypothetical protein BHE74_00008970 [Ensete ventricosum]|nr:hypothetical protein BHE74_00008970 [Ensete ventricosum]